MYEAVTHAANRHLYGTVVHRLQPCASAAHRRLRAAGGDAARVHDARVGLHAQRFRRGPALPAVQPLTKAKVTSEGERVITGLWDVIAAKGVEKDTFFETVSREIGLLPRLEGTVHINIGLLAKFMPNFLFAPDASLPSIPRRERRGRRYVPVRPGPTGGLGKVRFHDWRPSFDTYAHLGNVALLA